MKASGNGALRTDGDVHLVGPHPLSAAADLAAVPAGVIRRHVRDLERRRLVKLQPRNLIDSEEETGKGHRELSLGGVRDRDSVPVPLVSRDGPPHGATLQLQALPGVQRLRLRLDHQLQPSVQGVVALPWRRRSRGEVRF